jgi:hypothetical protein
LIRLEDGPVLIVINDEPSSVLLERIREQRATSKTTNKKTRLISKKKNRRVFLMKLENRPASRQH